MLSKLIKQMRLKTTEAELTSLIQNIAKSNRGKAFAYFAADDIESEVWIICLRAIKEFDVDSGNSLEHFLRKSVANGLVNEFKRVTKMRGSPCPSCKYFSTTAVGKCKKFGEEKYPCDPWRKYTLSMNSKNALMSAVEVTNNRTTRLDLFEEACNKELIAFIESRLNKTDRKILEGIKEGKKIRQGDTKRLRKVCQELIKEFEGEKDNGNEEE